MLTSIQKPLTPLLTAVMIGGRHLNFKGNRRVIEFHSEKLGRLRDNRPTEIAGKGLNRPAKKTLAVSFCLKFSSSSNAH